MAASRVVHLPQTFLYSTTPMKSVQSILHSYTQHPITLTKPENVLSILIDLKAE